MAGIQIERCDERSILIINGRLLQVSDTEYAMLLRLLEQAAHGSFVLFEDLVSCLKLSPGPPPTQRSLRQIIYKHISSLRAILWLCGMDITNVRGHGYLLVRVADEEA